MIRSRLNAKSQTTIPRPVRVALGLGPGDEMTYEIDGRRVTVRKAAEPPGDDPFGTFREWGSMEDREAYADL